MARPKTQQINEHNALTERQELQGLQLVLCDKIEIHLNLVTRYITVNYCLLTCDATYRVIIYVR
jgi:hypothetical protein